jgi:hypothetical protein
VIWKRSDYDGNGIRDYASDYSKLYSTLAGTPPGPIALIDEALADARGAAAMRPKSGYKFIDLTGDAKTGPYDFTRQFGICAAPALYKYNRSGCNVFVMDQRGDVWMKDLGPEGETGLTVFPDVEAEGSGWTRTD